MSILEFPRVYFRGEVAWDPVVTNNFKINEAPAAYDEISCDSTLHALPVLAADQVAGFRQEAINEVTARNWNPAGSYRSPFYNTYISGVDLGDGLDTTDAFATAPVGFTGMLVDCEPYGTISSQIFFDDMSFGIQGGCRIYGKRIKRFNASYISFWANPSNDMKAGVASVMWQTGFAKDQGLQIDAFDSRVLQQLQASMAEPDVLGVMVRFVTYRTVYYNNKKLSNGPPTSAAGAAAKALQAQLNAGGFQPNPARSLMVGTVGIWRRNEVMTAASERALIATMARVPGQKTSEKGGPAVATAFARTTSKGIALDFSNTIPCSNRATDKFDLGTLTLTASGEPIATIDFSKYDRAAFEATSGIIDIPLDSSLTRQLAGKNLAITAGGTTYLQEVALRAVPLMPSIYVNQGESANVVVQVYEHGLPASSGVKVTMSDMIDEEATGVSLKTDAAGQATFPLPCITSKITGWVFQTGENPTLPVSEIFTTLNLPYTYQRVLPAEDEIGQLSPSWDNTYQYVLANWEAMAPCMDNWLRLGDEQQVRSYANMIKTLTDPVNFENFRFMPVTRDMSNGQRTLLYNFLNNSPLRADAPQLAAKTPVSASNARVERASKRNSIQELSRAMRSDTRSDE